MAARSYQITLAAAAQRLSDVYGDGAGVVNAAHDIPYRELHLHATGADAYLGADTLTTATVFGDIAHEEDGAPPESTHGVHFGPYESGPLKLSDLYAAGAGATLHILGIPF